jgi:tetratricopeptide (TPR) repeat protein
MIHWPNYPISDPVLSRVIEEGRLEVAREMLLERIRSNPHDGLSLAMTACVELALGQPDNAVARAWEALDKKPATTTVQNICGHLFLDTDELDQAAACFEKSLELDPDNIQAILGQGAALHKQRRFDEAIALYRVAATQHPDNPELQNQLGRAFNNKGELLKARGAYELALAYDRGHAEAHHNLGHVFRRMDNRNEAIKHFAQAATIRPGYFSALYNLATVHLAKEEFAQARKCFGDVPRVS